MLNKLILHKNSMWLLLIVLYATVMIFFLDCGSSIKRVVVMPLHFSIFSGLRVRKTINVFELACFMLLVLLKWCYEIPAMYTSV